MGVPLQHAQVFQIFAAASDHHRQGRLGEAERLYRRVLELAPDHPFALHALGLLAHQHGQSEAAAALFRRALEVSPDFAEAHNNLGVLLQAQDRLDEAAGHFERALALHPAYAEAHNNLGALHARLGRAALATLHFEQALAANPAYPDACNNLAMSHFAEGRFEAAIDRWRQLLDRTPGGNAGVEVCINKALYGLHLADPEAARRLARVVLAACPDSIAIRHGVAALLGEAVPLRADPGYIKALFGFFANNFDLALGRLDYSPRGLVALLAPEPPPDPPAWEILDAGCGTGLAAEFLRPLARTLTGCDLSPEMLARARATGHYDRLVEGELVTVLEASPEAFDVVLSADVLVYFGEIAPVLAAVFPALRPGGLFAFSMESGDGGPDDGAGFSLGAGGRYRHTSQGVRRRAASHGFQVRQVVFETLRWEAGQPIPGLLAVLRKPGPEPEPEPDGKTREGTSP